MPYLSLEMADDDGVWPWVSLLGTRRRIVVDELAARLNLSATEVAKSTHVWSELAFWYPSTSHAAGARVLPGVRNIDMTTLGGDDGPGLQGSPSHSFLWIEPLKRVWSGFVGIRDELR
jgi:hypothetical protein